MADAFDESFDIVEELEISEMEEPASVPNFDNVTTFSCRVNCIRERTRNVCPCKSLNQYCSSVCHAGISLCVDLNSVCFKVLVPVKIFQFSDMHYENRFLVLRFKKKTCTKRINYGEKTMCRTIVPSWRQHTYGMVMD